MLPKWKRVEEIPRERSQQITTTSTDFVERNSKICPVKPQQTLNNPQELAGLNLVYATKN